MNHKIEKSTLTTDKPADKKNTERLTAALQKRGFRASMKVKC